MNKEELKENFKGYYKIDEVINYIDKVNSTYIYEYNNIKCIVYYCKNVFLCIFFIYGMYVNMYLL